MKGVLSTAPEGPKGHGPRTIGHGAVFRWAFNNKRHLSQKRHLTHRDTHVDWEDTSVDSEGTFVD